MAEKKAEKTPAKKPDAAPKAAKAKGPRADVTARSKATPAAPEGERCSVEKCSQPARAKGLCRKHYMAWRRGVAVGPAHRYKICSKEACRKPRTHGGLCDEHAGKTAAPAAA